MTVSSSRGLIRFHIYTATLLHDLEPLLSYTGRLSRAVKGDGNSAECFWFASGASLKHAAVLVSVPRDVERVAVSVAEAVGDGAAQAALLLDGLLQRLRLAPVKPQITALCHEQSFVAGLQNFVG